MTTDRIAAMLPDKSLSAVRSDVYTLLAHLLVQPPSVDGLKQLADLTILSGIPASLGRALSRLREAAGRTDAVSAEREYADLFIGLGRGQVVPYASWYAENLLMAAPLARLRTDLAVLNIHRREGVCEPEDHAGALCEIMVLIIAETLITAEQQAHFFNVHLTAWLIRFFRDLQRARAAVFYRSVGNLGEHFMLQEEQLQQRLFVEEV
jgi:TorA maturation chaperone TorD